MQRTLLIPIAAFLLASLAVLAIPQAPLQGVQGLDPDGNGNEINEGEMTCSAMIISARGVIKAHPDNWREWYDEMRHNTSARIEECEKQLSQNDTEVRDFMEYNRQVIDCKGSINGSPMTVVAIIFIILFILAAIALIAVSVMYYRK